MTTAISSSSTAKAIGIDVSGHQPIIDWQGAAAAGNTFAFIKATESTTLVDRSFAGHWAQAKSAGLLRSAYHFFRPQHDGVAQAQLFLAQLPEPGELPPVLDVEVVDGVALGQIAAGVSAWVDHVSAALGRAIIYTSPGFWNLLPSIPGLASKVDLWVAHWGVASPAKVNAWPAWRFWQFSDNATVSGIPGSANVDEDRFNGTIADLQAYSSSFMASLPPPGTQSFDLQTVLGIQRALNFLKVVSPPIEEDGIFGPQTRSAVEAFQSSAGLVADSIPGPGTIAALRSALAE